MADYRNYDAVREGFISTGFPDIATPQGYVMMPTQPGGMSGFWQMTRQGLDTGQMSGWKMHLSIAPEDLGRAWGPVSEYLASAGVGAYKVAAPETAARFGNPDDLQSGKMITIYDTPGGPDLRVVAQDLENILSSHGIARGPEVRNERPLPGSGFTSYRNDYDQSGRYISNEELNASGIAPDQRYNVSGQADPFQGFSITPPPAPRGFDALLTEAQQNGHVHELETNKGIGIYFSGSRDELVALESGFQERGIETQRMRDQGGQPALRIRTEGIEATRDLLEATSPAARFDSVLAATQAEGRVHDIPTNKGIGLAMSGHVSDLAVLETGFQERGIATERIADAQGNPFLRVRSGGTQAARELLETTASAAEATAEAAADTRRGGGVFRSIAEKTGRAFGFGGSLAISGVSFAATYVASGGDAQAATLSAAEASPASSVIAAAEGRTYESTLRAIEEVPGGILYTEIQRPWARLTGYGDTVDPGIIEDAVSAAYHMVAGGADESRREQIEAMNAEFIRPELVLPPASPPDAAQIAELEAYLQEHAPAATTPDQLPPEALEAALAAGRTAVGGATEVTATDVPRDEVAVATAAGNSAPAAAARH
jgi:hypothetical protein